MRYFIAIAVIDPAKSALDRLRARISERFKVYRALNSPPHLTMFYPFEADSVFEIEQRLERLASELKPFSLPIKGFGSFRDDVWFLDPEQDERLGEIKKAVGEMMAETTGLTEKNAWKGFHFHVTLAFRDVSPAVHRQIGEFLADEPLPVESLDIRTLTLFRLKEGGGWETAASFLMKG